MEFDIQAILENFQAECEEGFEQMEASLLVLERMPGNTEHIDAVFRTIHTVKGNAAALEMSHLCAFAHAIEDVLSRLRSSAVNMTGKLCSALLQSVDTLRFMVSEAVAGNDAEYAPARLLIKAIEMAATGEDESASGIVSDDTASSQLANHINLHQTTLRVKLDVLDQMMDLAGEIAILQSSLERSLAELGEPARHATETHQDIARLFLSLQECLLKVRMVPVQPLFQQFHRIVRDLAMASGKQVRLIVESGDVEVDTAIAEHLKDAMLHMLRNAIDHGLETPHERQAMGKDATGSIILRASHESGSIRIEVADDGAGFNTEKILARARQRGLVSDGQRLTETEIHALVFQPGFSTAEQVTGLSGRGVGMDVVRRNIDALHGSIQTESQPGRGTTFQLRLPLTLAIIEGFTVSVSDESYVVPMDSVVECMDLPADRSHGQECGVINLRGTPLPFLRLRDMFGLPAPEQSHRENILVVSHAGKKTGIAVDRLLGKGQAVIKPLGKLFQGTPGIAGSTILGDGQVALILDVPTLVREAVTRQQELVTQ